MRTSLNFITESGTLVDGYDYVNQAWVANGVYQDCGHPQKGAEMPARTDSFWRGGKEIKLVISASIFPGCQCYGRAHEGETCTVRGDGRSETKTEGDVQMGTRAIFKGKVITKSTEGYVLDGNIYPTFEAATDAAQNQTRVTAKAPVKTGGP